jgi:hypothetical protein
MAYAYHPVMFSLSRASCSNLKNILADLGKKLYNHFVYHSPLCPKSNAQFSFSLPSVRYTCHSLPHPCSRKAAFLDLWDIDFFSIMGRNSSSLFLLSHSSEGCFLFLFSFSFLTTLMVFFSLCWCTFSDF